MRGGTPGGYLALVAEVFRHHPFNLAIALDDDGQSGRLVSEHRFSYAPLERFVDQVPLFAHDADDVFLRFALQGRISKAVS